MIELDLTVAIIGAAAVVLAAFIGALFASMIGPAWTRHLDKKDWKSDYQSRRNDRVDAVKTQTKADYDNQVDRAVAMLFQAHREGRELHWRYELLGELEVFGWMDDHPDVSRSEASCTVLKHLRAHRELAGDRLRELATDGDMAG